MSQLVATINGVKVYSDKQLASMVNSRVTFTDGSYADVSTGEVVNKGNGTISLGNNPTSSGKKKNIQKRFDAKNLEVSNLAANVTISPHNQQDLVIDVTAFESAIEEITILQRGDTVIVKGNSTNNGGNINIVSDGGKSSIRVGNIRAGNIVVGGMTVINGSNITIGGGKSEPDIQIEIKVPLLASVDVSEVLGQVVIGDTLGNLRVQTSAGSSIKAGKVSKLRARASSSGSIDVASVSGKADLHASSSGSIFVRGGEIDELEAIASSSGQIKVHAPANEAELEASSSGSIYALSVKNQPRVHTSSSGHVSVGNW